MSALGSSTRIYHISLEVPVQPNVGRRTATRLGVNTMDQRAVRYVGPEGLHDGHLVSVERSGDTATVIVRTYEGETLRLEFSGVQTVTAVRPEGMLLYGLAEIDADGPLRQFMFANWEAWDNAGLKIAARDFRVVPADDTPAHPNPAV